MLSTNLILNVRSTYNNVNGVRDHTIIIHVQFEWNLPLVFQEELFSIHFPVMSWVELIFGIPMGTKHKHFKEPLQDYEHHAK
jgi:hypothetical protein